MTDYCIIINKSTVPVTTADKVRDAVEAELVQRKLKIDFDVISNPEFLKEGAAIFDFMHPDRIIVGTDNPKVMIKMRELYAPLIDCEERFIAMDFRSAELTKYAANAFLASKISFMNEMSRLAEHVGADIDLVRKGMGADLRIGPHFLFAGCGYGGACFPKDVRALMKISEQHGIQNKILAAVEKINEEQKQVLMQKISKHFKHDLKNKTIALWGLSFKPNTNDMREASSRILLEELWQQGVSVQAYDPVAMQEAKSIYGERTDLIFCETAERALANADALAIVTEWQEFRNPDFYMIKNQLRNPVIFDGRNLFDPRYMKMQGFTYYGIGRGENAGMTKGMVS
jgi:UDPglucose 6-dehydrogenase